MKNIQNSLMPHIPITEQRAGIKDTPKPLRYPERFSRAKLKEYARKIKQSLVYPLLITAGSPLNIESRVLPVRRMKEQTTAVMMKLCIRHSLRVFLHLSPWPAPWFWPTKVVQA